jgi:shikimate kinase
MQIFLTGVSCVGKTTIGMKIAEILGINFFDLDEEIESFHGTSIEQLQKRFLSMHSFRNQAAKALVNLLNRPDIKDCVVALPPSGLMGGYLRALKSTNGTAVVISDKPENILERLMFYDINSKPIKKKLTSKEKKMYLNEIRKDITYFRTSYRRSKLHVEISGLDPYQAACKIIEAVERLEGAEQAQ